MLPTDDELRRCMDAMSGSRRRRFCLFLTAADLSGNFAHERIWARACEFLVEIEDREGYACDHLRRYENARDEVALARLIEADMREDSVLAAFAVIALSRDRQLPLAAWNAFARHERPGRNDNFATLRLLHWAGFDISARDSRQGGATPLHYFASTRGMPGTNARALRWLLAHGADPDAQDDRGASPLARLAVSAVWTPAQTQAWDALIGAGADMFLVTDLGQSPLELMDQADVLFPNGLRRAVLDRLALTPPALWG